MKKSFQPNNQTEANLPKLSYDSHRTEPNQSAFVIPSQANKFPCKQH
jgi:hypothetical protein